MAPCAADGDYKRDPQGAKMQRLSDCGVPSPNWSISNSISTLQDQDTSKREDYGSQRIRMPAVKEGLLALTTAPMKPQPYGCLNKIHTITPVDTLAWMRDTSQGHTHRWRSTNNQKLLKENQFSPQKRPWWLVIQSQMVNVKHTYTSNTRWIH